MIDVQARLEETNQAIAYLEQRRLAVPAEALELREIMQRCVLAELALASKQLDPTGMAKQAYEAHLVFARSYASAFPPWDALSDDVRDGWLYAVGLVTGLVLRELQRPAGKEPDDAANG